MTTDAIDADLLEAEIDELMARTNLLRPEAASAVLLRHGIEVSDLEPARPLTVEERERLGLGRSALDEFGQRRLDRQQQIISGRSVSNR